MRAFCRWLSVLPSVSCLFNSILSLNFFNDTYFSSSRRRETRKVLMWLLFVIFISSIVIQSTHTIFFFFSLFNMPLNFSHHRCRRKEKDIFFPKTWSKLKLNCNQLFYEYLFLRCNAFFNIQIIDQLFFKIHWMKKKKMLKIGQVTVGIANRKKNTSNDETSKISKKVGKNWKNCRNWKKSQKI